MHLHFALIVCVFQCIGVYSAKETSGLGGTEVLGAGHEDGDHVYFDENDDVDDDEHKDSVEETPKEPVKGTPSKEDNELPEDDRKSKANDQPIEKKPASDPLSLRMLDDEAEAGERQSNLLSLAGSFINRAYMRLGFVGILRSYELQIEKQLNVLNAVTEQIIAQGEAWIDELKTFPEMQNEVIARHKDSLEDVRERFERVMPRSGSEAVPDEKTDEATEEGDTQDMPGHDMDVDEDE